MHSKIREARLSHISKTNFGLGLYNGVTTSTPPPRCQLYVNSWIDYWARLLHLRCVSIIQQKSHLGTWHILHLDGFGNHGVHRDCHHVPNHSLIVWNYNPISFVCVFGGCLVWFDFGSGTTIVASKGPCMQLHYRMSLILITYNAYSPISSNITCFTVGNSCSSSNNKWII